MTTATINGVQVQITTAVRGPRGFSNYELWLEEGNEGTVEEYLATVGAEAADEAVAAVSATLAADVAATAADRVQTGQDRTAVHTDRLAADADATATAADRAAAHTDRLAADADATATAADRTAVHTDRLAADAAATATAADRVATAADRVQTGLDRASATAAAGYAQGMARLYASTTAGLAATVNADYFGVVGTGDTYATLYRNDSGVATAITSFSSKAMTDRAIKAIPALKLLLNNRRMIEPEADATFGTTLDLPVITTSSSETLGAGSNIVPDTAAITRIVWTTVGATHVATVTTALAHGLNVGDRAVIAGATDAAFNGTKTLTAVVDSKNFSFLINASAFPTTPDTSTTATWRRQVTSIPATDPSFSYPNVPRAVLGGSRAASWQVPSISLNPPAMVSTVQGIGFAVEFVLNDSEMEVMTGQGGISRMFVDGVSAGQTGVQNPTNISYPGQVFKMVWPQAKPRLIRLEFPYYQGASRWFGVNVKYRGAISRAPDIARPRVVVFYDSIGEGTGAASYNYSVLVILCRLMGWELINMSVGGTGVVANGSVVGKAKYIDRLEQDLKPYQPQIGLIIVSVNDGSGVSEATFGSLLDRAQSVAPNAALIGGGVVSSNATPTTISLSNSANAKAACDARGMLFLDSGIGQNGDPYWINSTNRRVYYGGVAATATATVGSGAVTAVNVASGGEGYDPHHALPTVTFTGGGGTGAAAVPVMNFVVGDIQVLNKGSGYTSAPDVTLSCGATAISRLTGSAVTDAMVTNPGGNYTAVPSVTFSGGGGTGATGIAVVENGKVIAITITAGGTGYTSAPTITIAESTTPATATATIDANGQVTAITITDGGGGFTSAPLVRFSGGGSGSGGAVAVAHLKGVVASVTVTVPGSGYATAPTVAISHPHPEASDTTPHPKTNGASMHAEHWAAQLRAQAA
jgi:hypothetical protein